MPNPDASKQPPEPNRPVTNLELFAKLWLCLEDCQNKLKEAETFMAQITDRRSLNDILRETE